MLLTAAATLAAAADLTPVTSRDKKVIRRWSLAGDPRGVAVGADGTIYVGLAEPQEVLAIDGDTGAIQNRLVLDSAEIASTKELVTFRTNRERTRLYIANGSDESATILSLPNLAVVREITLEGETVRDVVPDPKGRYVYILGRRVHVYDKDGDTELRTLPIESPMAIAASANALAVFATEDFGNTKATVVALFDPVTWTEVARDPLQTERIVEGAMFADNDRALVAFSRDYLFEKPVISRASKTMSQDAGGQMRMRIDFGDLVSSDRVCFPEGSGAQAATLAGADNQLVYAERRCSASGAFSGGARRVTPASLYGVSAYAVAYDRGRNAIVATDRAGFLTLYHVPRAAVVR